MIDLSQMAQALGIGHMAAGALGSRHLATCSFAIWHMQATGLVKPGSGEFAELLENVFII